MTYLRCWCCRDEHGLKGACKCTRFECPRGEQCKNAAQDRRKKR